MGIRADMFARLAAGLLSSVAVAVALTSCRMTDNYLSDLAFRHEWPSKAQMSAAEVQWALTDIANLRTRLRIIAIAAFSTLLFVPWCVLVFWCSGEPSNSPPRVVVLYVNTT